MIRVKHIRERKEPDHDAYIGRPSPLGNPFHLKQYTREEAIFRYDRWLHTQIERHQPEVLNELSRLRDIHARTGKLNLVCFCAPQACHGDVIKRVLEST